MVDTAARSIRMNSMDDEPERSGNVLKFLTFTRFLDVQEDEMRDASDGRTHTNTKPKSHINARFCLRDSKEIENSIFHA